jgi:hypothetical protein
VTPCYLEGGGADGGAERWGDAWVRSRRAKSCGCRRANEERGTARRDQPGTETGGQASMACKEATAAGRDDGERWGSVGWTVERQGGEAFRIDGT